MGVFLMLNHVPDLPYLYTYSNESTGEKEDLREDGWTKYVRMTSKRRGCRLMMCTTVLHGGVCHRTSTPHKSGIKTKEKKIDL